LHCNPSAHAFGEGFDDGESESDASGGAAAGGFEAVEGVEDAGLFGGGDAGTAIAHLNDGFLGLAGEGEGEGVDGFGKLGGVGEELLDDLVELFGVGLDGDGGGEQIESEGEGWGDDPLGGL
jgi:hypothetical protein